MNLVLASVNGNYSIPGDLSQLGGVDCVCRKDEETPK